MASHFWRPSYHSQYRPYLSKAISFVRLSLHHSFHVSRLGSFRGPWRGARSIVYNVESSLKRKKLSSQSLCSSSSTKRAAIFSFIVIHVRFKADPSEFPFRVDGLRNILCAPFVSVILKKWRSKGQRLLPRDDRKSRLASRFSLLRLPSFCPFSR